MKKKIAIIAGEASGDLIASLLMKELNRQARDMRYEIEFFGIGGAEMQKITNFRTLFNSSELSVMGYIEVIKHLPRILWVRMKTIWSLRRFKPDVFIGVDAPDFNLGVELSLRHIFRHRNNFRVVHYVSPSIWAWRYKRIHKIKQAVDLMLCIFSMEEKIYRDAGVNARFIGNPLAAKMLDDIDELKKIDQDILANKLSFNNLNEQQINDREISEYQLAQSSISQKHEQQQFGNEQKSEYQPINNAHQAVDQNEFTHASDNLLNSNDNNHTNIQANNNKHTNINYSDCGANYYNLLKSIKSNHQGNIFTILVGSRELEIKLFTEIIIQACHLISHKMQANKESEPLFLFPFTSNYIAELFEHLIRAKVHNSLLVANQVDNFHSSQHIKNQSHIDASYIKHQCIDGAINKPYIFKYKILLNKTTEAIYLADQVLCKSGSVTLQVALAKKPMIVFYKMKAISAFLIKLLIKTKFVSQPNIILNDFVVKELLQAKCNANDIYKEFIELLYSREQKVNMINKFDHLQGMLLLKNPPSFYAASAILNL